jgi:hypothetical protein
MIHRFSIPNLEISSIIGSTFLPNGVSEYSTREALLGIVSWQSIPFRRGISIRL